MGCIVWRKQNQYLKHFFVVLFPTKRKMHFVCSWAGGENKVKRFRRLSVVVCLQQIISIESKLLTSTTILLTFGYNCLLPPPTLPSLLLNIFQLSNQRRKKKNTEYIFRAKKIQREKLKDLEITAIGSEKDETQSWTQRGFCVCVCIIRFYEICMCLCCIGLHGGKPEKKLIPT